jgi:hypothetical protein
MVIRQQYFDLHSREPDLASAHPFTDKLYRRMVEINRSGCPTLSRLADKYLIRDYVKEQIGSAHLFPLLWSGTDPSRTPFDHLPRKCAVKTNHGSGHADRNTPLNGARSLRS